MDGAVKENGSIQCNRFHERMIDNKQLHVLYTYSSTAHLFSSRIYMKLHPFPYLRLLLRSEVVRNAKGTADLLRTLSLDHTRHLRTTEECTQITTPTSDPAVAAQSKSWQPRPGREAPLSGCSRNRRPIQIPRRACCCFSGDVRFPPTACRDGTCLQR